jgi:hypothetical protein
MKIKERVPELKVGNCVPDGFTSLRGAQSMRYSDGIGLKYRRHFWYVTKHNYTVLGDVVEYVCTSYQDASEKYQALVEQQQ